MAPAKARRYVSCSEVATVVGVHKATVRKWARDGLVIARLTPGQEWRVAIHEDGWPVESE